jgi:hypothetical protein
VALAEERRQAAIDDVGLAEKDFGDRLPQAGDDLLDLFFIHRRV